MRVKRLSIFSMVVLFTVGILISSSYAKIDLGSIVGMWLFERGEGDIAEDSSGNGNHGKISGAKWIEGVYGKALDFNGEQEVIVPHSDELTLSNFTLAAWIKTPRVDEKGSGVLRKVTEENSDERNYILGVSSSNGWVSMAYTSGGPRSWQSMFGKTRIDNKTWRHIAAVYDMQSMKVYVDGSLDAETEFGSLPDVNVDPLIIGYR